MSKTFTRHAAELDTGIYGSGFIRGLKLSLNRQGRVDHGWSVGSAYSGLKSDETGILCNRIVDERPRVDAKQAEKGLAWLLKLWHTPRGTVRRNSPFAAREENVLRNFDHFELAGFYADDDAEVHYQPVYRAVARDGSSFEYQAYPWQARAYEGASVAIKITG